ncbi:Phage tail protein E [compost metagenome]
MDVLALRKVLPRISTPTLTEADVGRLDPADLMQCGVAVSSFLLTKAAKEGSLVA